MQLLLVSDGDCWLLAKNQSSSKDDVQKKKEAHKIVDNRLARSLSVGNL